MAKHTTKAPRNPPSCFSFSYFTVSVTPSTNKIFHALTAPFPLIFLSDLLTAFEVKLLTNSGKLSLTKGIAIFVSAFFPKLPNQEPKNPPD